MTAYLVNRAKDLNTVIFFSDTVNVLSHGPVYIPLHSQWSEYIFKGRSRHISQLVTNHSGWPDSFDRLVQIFFMYVTIWNTVTAAKTSKVEKMSDFNTALMRARVTEQEAKEATARKQVCFCLTVFSEFWCASVCLPVCLSVCLSLSRLTCPASPIQCQPAQVSLHYGRRVIFFFSILQHCFLLLLFF